MASLSTTLDSLTKALNSANSSIEKLQLPLAVEEGISILDVKNELFLSYLHNLIFLIIHNLRNQKNPSDKESKGLGDSITKKLVELQIYIEKGVRPLENRLKYQIEKVFRAADDAKIAESKKTTNLDRYDTQTDSEESSEGDSDVDSVEGTNKKPSDIHELQFRPNPSSFIHPTSTATIKDTKGKSDSGIYKPPKIHATSMHMTRPQENKALKPRKLATVDEFINNEMSSMPIAEPSIGSTIKYGGRKSLSTKEINEQKEKIEYEEQNYIRLPTESKKDRSKKRGPRNPTEFGGEELMGLGQGIDRIDRLTRRKSGEKRNVLEQSRKRPIENESSYSGVQAGQVFQKRIKRLDKTKNKKKKNLVESTS